MNSEKSWQTELNLAFSKEGIRQYGISPLSKPMSISFYSRWLKAGFHADMKYLEAHLETKSEPTKLLPAAKTLISVAVPYEPHPKPTDLPFRALSVAKYAQGEDYHHWLLSRLQRVCDQLKALYPEEEFLCFTDSQPLFEKEWAARNNLGWVGKNSLLLNKELGSLFFLGEILTTLNSEAENEFVVPDHCGKCDRCIQACPTDAILEDRSLDANLCLAFLNIESKKPAPEHLRQHYGTWLFGCDICQDVCPWNQKVFAKTENEPDADIEKELLYILKSSNKKLMKDLKGTPLTRAGGRGLKRTALIIIGANELHNLRPDLESLNFENPELSELKDWALTKITS